MIGERTRHALAAAKNRGVNQPQQNLLEHLPCDGDLGHLEDNIAAWLTTFAPILISLSFRLVNDQSLRRRQRAQELPRL